MMGALALAGLLVVVPFAPPGNKDAHLTFADRQMAMKLAAAKVQVVVSEPIDAATSAPSLCQKYGGDGILVGTLRHDQHQAPMYHWPSHTEIRLERLRCDGKVTWKGVAIGDVDRQFGNPPAHVDASIDLALDNAVQQLLANLAL